MKPERRLGRALRKLARRRHARGLGVRSIGQNRHQFRSQVTTEPGLSGSRESYLCSLCIAGYFGVLL
jgi:hypothetical protein